MTQLSWGIYSHTKALESIQRDFKDNKLQHTSLVAGPPEIGKFTVLKKLAQVIHCEEGGCFKCNTCRLIDEESHIDTFIFKTEGNELGIKDFRTLQKYLNLSPQNKYKVVIIQDVERLSIPLQNSMLKILEEPPEYVIFLLSTSNLDNLLDTIVSRARIYKMGLASDIEVKEYLDKEFNDLSLDKKLQIQFFAAGKIGKANSLAVNSDMFNRFNEWKAKIEEADTNSAEFFALKLAEEINEYEKPEITEFLELLISYYRQKMLASQNKFEKKEFSNKIMECFKSLDLLSKNVNVKISLEVLFLHCFTKLSSIMSH